MSNITSVEFKTGEISLDADTVLEKSKGNYTALLIIGWDTDGRLDVRSTNNLDQKDCTYLTNLFTHKLMNGDFIPEEFE